MLRRWWLALALLCVAAKARATYVDHAAALSFEHYPSAKNGDGQGQTRLNVLRASVGLPFKVADRTLLLAGAAYELLDVHHSAYEPFQLHAPKLSFGVIQGITEKWGVFVLTNLGFASDFTDGARGRDVLFSVLAIGTYKVSKSVELGAGVIYDRFTGGLLPLPALSLDLRPHERFRIRGFAPVWLNAEYRALDWLDVGVRSTFEGNRFHLAKSFDQPNVELAYSILTVGPKLTFNFSDWLHLDAYAAFAAYRRYELFHDDERLARYGLESVLGYGARFWIAPSGW